MKTSAAFVLALALALSAAAQSPSPAPPPSPAAAPPPANMNRPLPEIDIAAAIADPALRQAITDARAASEESFGKAHVTTGTFATTLGQVFVPVQVYFSAADKPEATGLRFFATAENAAGKTVLAIDEPATLADSKGDFYFDRSLVLPPATYTLLVGLADAAGKPVSWQRRKLAVSDPRAEPQVSELMLSDNLSAMAQAQRETDPFAFGGVKVVPKGDRNFMSSEGLWYFFNVWTPALDADTNPKLTGQLDVLFNGKPRARMAAQPLKATKLSEGRYAVGAEIPLGNFKPGSYDIVLKVKDEIAGKEFEKRSTFYVRPEGTQAGTAAASPAPPAPPKPATTKKKTTTKKKG